MEKLNYKTNNHEKVNRKIIRQNIKLPFWRENNV